LNKDLKRRIIDISYRNKLSHLGSCLTSVDIIDDIFKIKKPNEKFILSSGHAGLALYVVLEKYGGRNAEDIFRHHGVHPDRCSLCSLDCSTGSLGHGIGIALGMAFARPNKNVYCLMSDGECAEGSVWEALRIQNGLSLKNLKVYINWNNWSAYKQPDKFTRWIVNHIDYINVRETNFNLLMPILKEPQEAHYKVMNEKEYKLIMEKLQ